MMLWNTPRIEIYQNSREQTAGNYGEITLATFKQWLKWDADDTSEDTIMTAILKGTIKAAEMYTGRVISRATWRTYLQGFTNITLDVQPVDLTTGFSVKYYNDSNVLTTVDASDYVLTNNGPDRYSAIEFDFTTTPEVYDRNENVYLEYFAGYTTIPDELMTIILAEAANRFETRTNEVAGSMGGIQMGFHQRLFPFKML